MGVLRGVLYNGGPENTMTSIQTDTLPTPSTSLDEIPKLVTELRATFESGKTRPKEWRRGQLDALLRLVREHQEQILDALAADVGKPRLEAYAAEVSFMENDIVHVKKHLSRWMKPERVPTPLVNQPGKSRIRPEPLGVALIIAPWNYPFQLALSPLVGALAAGCCALLKPSEVAPATSKLIAELVPQYLDVSAVKVVEGGIPETTKLLEERFDHIFYTGNGHVGRIVMRAAAEHLTPVTLELGGKSPCIVDHTADLDVTARRLVWGKFYNCGQTCVAPDYVLVEESIHDAFLNRVLATIREFWGDDPQKSPDYGRVVNARHLKRLLALLEGSDVVAGGNAEEADRYLAPTVLDNVSPDAKVMQDEIFGPIMPVMTVPNVDAAIRFINARPKPLALYHFSGDKRISERVLTRTSSGGACINHCLMHLTVPELPFGGVGESGMGAYHGKGSFDTFSHRKSVLSRPFVMDPPVAYPPYTDFKEKVMKRLL